MGQGDEDRSEGWNGGEGAEPSAPESQRLDLADEKQLPWLESADDEDDYDYESGHGRLIVLALLGLVAIGALVGGGWWYMRQGGDAAVVADGSTIPAPKTPYKEAPKDPGGKTFDGTGDTSFAVSEGQTRPAKLDQTGEAAPAPAPVATPSPSASASAAPKLAATPSASGGVGVQVGAYSSEAAAKAAWTRLSGQYEALQGVSHRIQQGKADIGTVYRLQAVAGDAAAANALCSRLKAAGLACQVKQ